MDVYLVRHTTPNIATGYCYGQREVGLADVWQDEFAQLLNKLPSTWDRVYSSPWPRCYQLAQQLADEPTEDARLQELNFGDWEGQRWSDIPQTELNPWMEDFVNVACPGGESYRQLSDRATAFWLALTRQEADTVAVVTHGGPIRAVLSAVLGLPLENSFRLAIDYGSVSLVRIQNQHATIQFINK